MAELLSAEANRKPAASTLTFQRKCKTCAVGDAAGSRCSTHDGNHSGCKTTACAHVGRLHRLSLEPPPRPRSPPEAHAVSVVERPGCSCRLLSHLRQVLVRMDVPARYPTIAVMVPAP